MSGDTLRFSSRTFETVSRKTPSRQVFTYKGKPIRHISTAAWKKAKARAGVTDYRWHDNRHTWASWMRQNGVSLDDLQELGALNRNG